MPPEGAAKLILMARGQSETFPSEGKPLSIMLLYRNFSFTCYLTPIINFRLKNILTQINASIYFNVIGLKQVNLCFNITLILVFT